METQTITGVVIRLATIEDVPAIAALVTPFVEDGKLLARTLDEFEDLLPNMFVADHHGEIVGAASLEIYSPKLAEVRSLAVSSKVQGMGIGKLLVLACVELARHNNILEIMAITSSDAFFRACGFDYTLPGEKRALFIQTREK
jgi:N-acetylglutamate synthase-like GNAT family acetyltransferase